MRRTRSRRQVFVAVGEVISADTGVDVGTETTEEESVRGIGIGVGVGRSSLSKSASVVLVAGTGRGRGTLPALFLLDFPFPRIFVI